MDFVSSQAGKGVVERRFDLKVDQEVVPGVLWSPEGADGPTPLILIGHGGTQHKRVPNVLGMARGLVRHLGYSAAAIDAVGHGDRVVDQAAAAEARRALEQRISAGPGQGGAPAMGAEQARQWVHRTERGVIEWKATLDALQGAGLADDRVGYWGVSMGTAIGLPFVYFRGYSGNSAIDGVGSRMARRSHIFERMIQLDVCIADEPAHGRMGGVRMLGGTPECVGNIFGQLTAVFRPERSHDCRYLAVLTQ